MPRKAYLAPYYSSEELKHKYRTSPDSVESRRWHLKRENISGVVNQKECGLALRVRSNAIAINYDYAKEIVKKYNKLEKEGVKNQKNKQRKQSGGRKPLLTKKQFKKLQKELELKPDDGGVWTGTLISALD